MQKMFLYRKGIGEWLNDPKRQKGCCREQVRYLRELKECDKELARIGVLTFFLVTKLNINDARKMMISASKQRGLIYTVCKDLKLYRVDPEWYRAFELDIKGFQRRCEHVFKICKEDLRLSEHYPYFESVGFDRLLDIPLIYTETVETPLDKILPDLEAWEADHRPEIDAHMESVREEIEIRDRHKAEVAEKEKAEKEAAKAKRKAERDEIKEIKKNAEAYRKRQRKLDKEFERYYS